MNKIKRFLPSVEQTLKDGERQIINKVNKQII